MEFNNIDNTECPVEDLLYLIQQDNIEHLQTALLDIVDRFQPDGRIYLYEHGYSVFNSENKLFSPKLIGSRGEIEKSDISFNKDGEFINFNFTKTQKHIQVFVVESERITRGLLITVNKNHLNEGYINCLLNAYNHIAYLLKHKDTDSLTGLLNRQSLDNRLSKLHSNLKFRNRTRDNITHYTFAMLDIDFFKSVNDTFGHVYGDEVLLLFSNVMKETFREVDLLFRYGGEEFAVLLYDVNVEQSKSALNRFRKNVEKFKFPMEKNITVSTGFCQFTNEFPLSSIIERADKALYFSKTNGRNQVNGFELLLQQNKVQDITVIDDGDIEIF